MTYESKILNVTLRKPKIHFVPDVVYAQVPTFEKPNQLLQMNMLIPQIEKKCSSCTARRITSCRPLRLNCFSKR